MLSEAGVIVNWGDPTLLDSTFVRAMRTRVQPGTSDTNAVAVDLTFYERPLAHRLPGPNPGPLWASVHVEKLSEPGEPAYWTDPSEYISVAITAAITLSSEAALKAAWKMTRDKLRQRRQDFEVDDWKERERFRRSPDDRDLDESEDDGTYL